MTAVATADDCWCATRPRVPADARLDVLALRARGRPSGGRQPTLASGAPNGEQRSVRRSGLGARAVRSHRAARRVWARLAFGMAWWPGGAVSTRCADSHAIGRRPAASGGSVGTPAAAPSPARPPPREKPLRTRQPLHAASVRARCSDSRQILKRQNLQAAWMEEGSVR